MTPTSEPPSRRLILLGSAGSIGVNALQVVEHLHRAGLRRFEIVGLATGANALTLAEQAERFDVEHVALADDSGANQLSGRVSRPRHLYTGPDAALELVEAVARPGDLVIGAMVGSAGLPATLAAIERGCDIALANKETLVAAGALVMPLVKSRGVNLLPVDSEHSAIFQCLAAGRSVDEVRRLVLTASGGPFRTWPAERLYAATVEETLNHPTWNMGPKVTVDSASLMNKALEVIEAHWLFGVSTEKIQVVVHPQSIVHSFVEFVDGSVVAQLSPPDMKSPIQYALTWPDRDPGCAPRMDWRTAWHLDFEPVDHQRFPALGLAYRVVETGGSAGAVFNAANEAAVAAYLERRIPFGAISQLVGETLDAIAPAPIESLDDVHRADAAAREQLGRLIAAAPQRQEAETVRTT
ncbi:MAG: 1-deoxy-D-xylulose-5-phosphate reductoisomerase [Planctomycetota bacterium]|jgi:1-deoxy-D-xylulose-5-phosphate reductoisomerase